MENKWKHKSYLTFSTSIIMKNASLENTYNSDTWVMKLWAPFRPSSSPVLNKKITELLKLWAQCETPLASSNMTATHELQSPAPPLKYTMFKQTKDQRKYFSKNMRTTMPKPRSKDMGLDTWLYSFWFQILSSRQTQMHNHLQPKYQFQWSSTYIL